MLGGILPNLLVTVTLLFVTPTVTQCRGEIDFSSVTLPGWGTNSEYVTQCVYDSRGPVICDWNATEDGVVTAVESGPLRLEGEACLEFWYLAPVATNGTELRVLLKSSVGLKEIWTLPPRHRDAWRQVFVPLDIINPGTQVVIEAASTEGQFEFNRMGVRRGSCGPQCESDAELWTDESTRCLCPGGQLSCSPSQCPEGQSCTPQRGASTATCTVHSHTDCSTFDGEVFRFMMPCTYTLAKTCSPSEAMPMFTVEVVNEQSWNSSLPTVQQVVVNMGNFRVSLLKRETSRIVVNGVWKKLPLSLSSGTVNIKSHPAAVELGTGFGLLVSYDNTGAVHVTLPSLYSDKVCGLCGNYNHDRRDDFRKPDGTFAQNATAFAESWQSGQATSACETVLVPHQCDPLQAAEYASEQYCGGLRSSSGPFADCLSVLEGESYFRGCVASMCSSHGDPTVLCEVLQVYSDICQEAGVSIPIWRNSSYCPLLCGENSHYNACADGCPEVCSSLDIVGPCGSCEERCECDSGLKLSGGNCVPAEDCGCWYDGNHYENGATFSKGECEQLCQCMGNNDMQCTTMQCADKEICKVKDGVKGCFPFKPATCSVYGDPHYITFDGMAYDFQGGCSYTLTTTCAKESSVQFTVIGHNMHPALQNTRSKLEAVALQVEDLYLTLNQSGAVYVNNSLVRLPYSTNGTFGSVWVHQKKNYIILETTFGLRMTIDARNRLFLEVDEQYKYELCGLCGTYSERQDDDFVTPGGQNATGSLEFGDSWRLPGDNECISHPSDPRHCDYHEENEAYNECYTLLGDAFKPCHELIHPNIYLNSCVYDYCATNGDQHTLCESLKSYAAACQFAGVELPNWQSNTACAEPPTTTAHPTPSTATSPTTDHTLCPINCDFEKNLCGWEQLLQDSFDWKRHSGSTPSSLTGPNQDHTTGAGFYMYIEGNNVTHGDSARLWSSMCHYNGPLCLRFWYHMYGSATSMALNIYLLKDNKATKLWVMMNNQGPEWHPGIVDIPVSGPFQMIIEGIRGSNTQSDVAIDDISIHFSSCSGNFPGLGSGTVPPSLTAAVPPSLPICNMDCSFDGNLCSWNQMVTDTLDWTWQNGSTSTPMTGPSADHTDGHYLYMEADNASHGDMARLISSECSESGPQCLQFWYHMYGSADTMGLHVYLLQNKVADALWGKRNDNGNIWKLAQLDITTTGAFQIIIEGRRGSNEESDVAIDDVKLYRGQCPDVSGVTTSPPKPDENTSPPMVLVPTTVFPQPPVVNVTAQLPVTARPPVANVTVHSTVEAKTDFINGENVTEAAERPPPVCQLNCNFDQDLCQWDQLLTDAFDWTRYSGSTPTTMTGPSSDHTTGGGHYLYIEANNASHGDTARLISSECSDSGPQCLQFWYHMYGSADTMGLHVYLLQDRVADAVWWKRNDHGNVWQPAQLDITTTGAFQIIFEGRRGSNIQSDVAIDDVILYRGSCTVATVGPEFPTTATQTHSSTLSKPQPTLTATFTTNTDIPTTRPQQPITSKPITTTTTGPPTTTRPHPPTTEYPRHETPEQPEPEFTEKPQTTASPEPPTASANGPPTTTRPYPPTTEYTGLGTPEHTEPEMTERPEQPAPSTNGSPTTAGPHPPTAGLGTPEPEFTEKPQTTASPDPLTTSTNGPPTTTRPHPPTTEYSGLGTPEHPEPEMTARPEQPATSTNGSPTTARPHPQTTGHPGDGTPEQLEPEFTEKPQTNSSPEPPTASANGPPTTAGPHPPTTGLGTPEHEFTEKPQTTASPEPLTTSTNGPPTTAVPHPPTTAGPHSTTTTAPQRTTTNKPHSTTGRPLPTTPATPQPQTTHVPTPSCPENSHYTTCVPQCSPTCEHLNGPSDCSDHEGCVKGCVCDDGFVRTSKACVPIQRCGCVDRNGTTHNFNKEWYTDHCSKKCECEKDDGVGKIDCDDKDECDGKAVCLQNEAGNYYCQSTGFGECTIRGDPEYRTFDEMKFDFEGKYSYVLVSTNNLPYYLPHVYIEGTNTLDDEKDRRHHGDGSSEEDNSRRSRGDDDDDSKHDDDSEEHKEHHRLQELKIRVYDHTVVLKQNCRLIVDGRETKTPTSPTAGLNISLHSSRIYLKTDFGLSVEFDGRNAAEIILPNLYKRKVGGLCGNFDGHKGNDLMKPDGTRAKSIKKFGDSWRV
uniref:zonadhesin isoform X2 n=1 Tax=Gasterosteus aculeatus aculeatus TaxID=481459 RepID=UPI001A999CBC|nr:zonadhesin isoform X2 [Gasterosteus aculeatus aculeatus]